MTNQPIEEKWNWQEEFDESFDYLYQRTEVNGTECFTTQHEAVKSFIENLLEQEKRRMSEEIEEMKTYTGGSSVNEKDRRVNKQEVLSIINK